VEDLTRYTNTGQVLAGKLHAAGITTLEDLIKLGSIEAMLQMGETNLSASANMLFALEGAIRGVRWHKIPKPQRDQLWEEIKQVVNIDFGS
jgi:DNA transformation protein